MLSLFLKVNFENNPLKFGLTSIKTVYNMKKLILSIALLTLPFAVTIAQTSFGFTGGYAQPLGAYAATETNAGYAKPGSIWGIRVDNYFPSKIGVGLMIKKHRNQINSDALQEDIRSEYGYSRSLLIQSASHKSFGFLVLGSYKFIDTERFGLDVSIGAGGAMNDMSDPLVIEAAKTATLNNYLVDYNDNFSWAWHSGVRFCYYISPSVGFTAGISYYGTNPTYEMVRQDVRTTVKSDVRTYSTVNQMMDYSFGIVFGH